jgi:hypothetical protein
MSRKLMPTLKNEQERVQNLRDQQLAERYAGRSSKLRYYGKLGNKSVTVKPKTLTEKIFGVLDKRFLGGVLGAILGFALMISVFVLLPRDVSFIGIIVLLIPMIMGYILGKAAE